MDTENRLTIGNSDQESRAISLCVEVLEPLTTDQTARVLTYVGQRYLERLRRARHELDATIRTIEQHARQQACELCRGLEREQIAGDEELPEV